MVSPAGNTTSTHSRPFARLAGMFSLRTFAWLAFGVSILSFAIRHDLRIFNSDYLYLPTLYRDLFEWGGRLSEWYLPPAPYFFPDMALYFLVTMVTGQWVVSYILVGTLQVILFVLGWVVLVKAMKPFGSGSPLLEAMAPIILSLILTLDTVEPVSSSLAVRPFILSSHFGLAVALPYIMALALYFSRQRDSGVLTTFILASIFVLCGLLTMSDSLFVVLVVCPLLCALALLVFRRCISLRSFLILCCGVLAGSGTGHLMRKALISYPIPPRYSSLASADVASRSLKAALEWSGEFFKARPIVVMIAGALIVLHIAVAALSLFSKRAPGWLDTRRMYISTFFSASVIFTIAGVILTGNFEDQHSSRYLMPLVMCLFCTIPFLVPRAMQIDEKMTSFAPFVCALIVLVNSPALLKIGQLDKYLAYHPPDVSGLDAELGRRDLKTGIGSYWDAKYITMLSQKGVNVLQVRPNLEPLDWISNPAWYKKHRPQFVLIDSTSYTSTPGLYRIPESAVIQRFGTPAETFTASGRLVLVYNRPSDSVFHDFLQSDLK